MGYNGKFYSRKIHEKLCLMKMIVINLFQDGSRNQNGYYYPPTQSHYHQQQAQPQIPMQSNHGPPIHAYNHNSYPYGNMSK